MKRFLLILASLIFAVSVLGISVVRQVQPEVLALGGEGDEIVVSVASESAKTVDYYLPYPGILPDHPLYWMKMIRDRVRLWLTRDSLDRVELIFHYADKRIGAADALAKGNKLGLAVTTATKAENYMKQVVGGLIGLEESGKEVGDWWERLLKASIRHQEILELILERVPDEAKASVDQIIGSAGLTRNKAKEMLGVEGEMEKMEETETDEMDEEGDVMDMDEETQESSEEDVDTMDEDGQL